MSEIAKIGIYGDMHLSSRNYGAHRDYPKESLEYFSKITEITRDKKLTHLIGTGDLTFGTFTNLAYRQYVEKQLEEQYKLTSGNRYELQGNHDITGAITERDFYINKGLIKPSQNLTIGNLHITMVDYGKAEETPVNIVEGNNNVNFIISHDYCRFSNTNNIGNFGNKFINLDTFERWFGADGLICGHIHKIMNFEGYITKGESVHLLRVYYPGCMMRPAYRDGYMDDKGQMIILTVYDDKDGIDFDIEEIQLWKIEDSFNLEERTKKKEKQKEKSDRVDISDVVKQLDLHDRNVGNPEDIINGLQDVDIKYKNKAIALLKQALNE